MKIGSYNIRGLGSSVKMDEIHSFYTKNDLDICCVQETKMETLSEKDGKCVWRSDGVLWSAEGAVGRSGGILTFWKDNKLCCTSHWNLGGAVAVNGSWRASGEELCIINVYAPCQLNGKLLLWDRLSLVVVQRSDPNLCIIGDFNSILEEVERVGLGRSSYSARDRLEFKEFLDRCNLTDANLMGRKYTWYKSGGSCKSRIDRALLNDKWLARWQQLSLRGFLVLFFTTTLLFSPRNIQNGGRSPSVLSMHGSNIRTSLRR